MQDLPLFLDFLKEYIRKRVVASAKNFEKGKDLIVAFLVAKRGKYSSSFLNTSFLFLVGAVIIGGPAIAENNPLLNSLEQTQTTASQEATVSYNPYDNSLGTIISAKPRDKMVQYKVRSGETLESIAKQFDISVDTVRWANDINDDTIKTGETLNIPPISGIAHKVVSGDNIYSIAKKYSVDAQNIVNFPFNDYSDLNTFALTPGQYIYVPGGVKPNPQAPVSQQQMFAQVQAGVRGSSSFIWPTTGIITQYPIWYHMALDIANPAQPAVIAADTGTVVFSGCIAYGYGCHIIIDHGNGYRSLYGHMSRLIAGAGQVVTKGQQIGVMGSTGNSSGTHLHFEIRSGETLLNPLNFLSH